MEDKTIWLRFEHGDGGWFVIRKDLYEEWKRTADEILGSIERMLMYGK